MHDICTLTVFQKHVSLLKWFCGTVLYQSNVPAAFTNVVSFQMELRMYENTLLNKDASLQKVGLSLPMKSRGIG